jgi:hypothetical protein
MDRPAYHSPPHLYHLHQPPPALPLPATSPPSQHVDFGDLDLDECAEESDDDDEESDDDDEESDECDEESDEDDEESESA